MEDCVDPSKEILKTLKRSIQICIFYLGSITNLHHQKKI